MIQATVNIGQSEIHLHKAILLYGSKDNPHSSTSVDYASLHAVTLRHGRPVIEAGESITRESLDSALRNLNGPSPLDLLDEHILAFNGTTLVFWVPPQKRKVWFECGEPMGKRSGVTPHPGLLFVVNSQLFVYAIKGSRRPRADTEIFCGPYLNTYMGGDICMGNVKIPTPWPSNAPAIANAFFRSIFTHTNSGHVVNYEGGIFSLWTDLLDGKYSEFPETSLLQGSNLPGKTLGQVLAHFGGQA